MTKIKRLKHTRKVRKIRKDGVVQTYWVGKRAKKGKTINQKMKSQRKRTVRMEYKKESVKVRRRVFFSFHYERDIWRANVVRKSWVTQDREDAGFWDASLWEEAKKKGDEAIKRIIDDGLLGTSVTVVLIGAETSDRKWVKYEIKKSYERGNGLLGIYIHNIRNQYTHTDRKGDDPFNKVYLLCPTYDWINNNGYSNLGNWVEEAAKRRGR